MHHHNLKVDIFTIILKGLEFAKKYKLSIRGQKALWIVCNRFFSSFDCFDSLEALEMDVLMMQYTLGFIGLICVNANVCIIPHFAENFQLCLSQSH